MHDQAAASGNAAAVQGLSGAAAVGKGQARLLLLGGQLDVVSQAQRLEAGHELPGDVELPPLQAVPRAAGGEQHQIRL